MLAGEVVEEEMNNVGHALGRYLIYNNEDATFMGQPTRRKLG